MATLAAHVPTNGKRKKRAASTKPDSPPAKRSSPPREVPLDITQLDFSDVKYDPEALAKHKSDKEQRIDYRPWDGYRWNGDASGKCYKVGIYLKSTPTTVQKTIKELNTIYVNWRCRLQECFPVEGFDATTHLSKGWNYWIQCFITFSEAVTFKEVLCEMMYTQGCEGKYPLNVVNYIGILEGDEIEKFQTFIKYEMDNDETMESKSKKLFANWYGIVVLCRLAEKQLKSLGSS